MPYSQDEIAKFATEYESLESIADFIFGDTTYTLYEYISDDENLTDFLYYLFAEGSDDPVAVEISKTDLSTSSEDELESNELYLDMFDAATDDFGNFDDMQLSMFDDEPIYKHFPEPPVSKIDSELVKNLSKSDTLVIHCKDASTEMLGQIYAGRGYDVIRDGNINKDDLHELLENHSTIICLGHGTPNGLINVQKGYSYIISKDEAQYLKDKKLFVIWCCADKYFLNNNIGHGQFITKNVPSEVWECAAVGYKVSADFILENITYWSKCCADVLDLVRAGNVDKAVKIARENYQKSITPESTEDEIGVINYNTDAIQKLP